MVRVGYTHKKQKWHSLYNTSHWKRLRLQQLTSEPVCSYCERMGRVVMATVVDHIKPHKGDRTLFFSPSNLQSMCKQHHDSTKQREESNGVVIGGDIEGNPSDPNHHWNS